MCVVWKDRKICRTARARRRGWPERWTNREEDQFVFIGPLFLFSVLRQLPPVRPSALRVSFTAKPLRAKLVNSSVTIRRANPRRRFYHRNGQLLTENYRLFALEFFIIEHRFYLNFANNKINGTLKDKVHVSKTRDNFWLNYIWIKQHTLPNCLLTIKQKFYMYV